MTAAATAGGRDDHCGGAKRDGSGTTCTLAAGWGTDHVGFGRCKLHGGSTGTHRKGAQLRAVEADAQALLAREGLSAVGDPVGKIAELAAEADAMRGALAARVNALTVLRFTDAKGAEQLRSEVALYERALDRTQRFCEALARLGYEDRTVRVRERQVDVLVAVIRGALERAGLGEAVRLRVLEAVPVVLGELVGTTDGGQQ